MLTNRNLSLKKQDFREYGINLTPDRRVKKEIFTLIGKIFFERMVLRPADPKSMERLSSDFGVKSIAPLDIYLGIDGLPCKMSIDMMLKCAFWAQNQCSYQLAEETMKKVFGYTVNDDTIRQVTNFIGRLVFNEDCRLAEKAWHLLESGRMDCPGNKNGVLYLEADGAERICELLEDGCWETVLGELDPEEKYDNAVNLYDYIDGNKEHINYPHYKEKGWFVGSGAIESGNKIVLQKRMKQAGMRWNPETAQYLVTLCSKKESGRWGSDVEDFVKKILQPGTKLRNSALQSI